MNKSVSVSKVVDLQSLLNRTVNINGCLEPITTKTRYPEIRWNGKSITGHRLALYFKTGYFGATAMHLCDNQKCWNPEHLIWGSPAQNSADMVAKNRQAKGSKIHQSKLTEPQVIAIRAEYAEGKESWRSLAAKYGVSKTVIGYIVRNKRWTHV